MNYFFMFYDLKIKNNWTTEIDAHLISILNYFFVLFYMISKLKIIEQLKLMPTSSPSQHTSAKLLCFCDPHLALSRRQTLPYTEKKNSMYIFYVSKYYT